MSDWKTRAEELPVDWKSRAEPVPPPQASQGPEAALQGAGSAMTLGYLPKLQSAAEGLINKVAPNPSDLLDQDLKSRGMNFAKPEDQDQQWQRREEGLQKNNPAAFLGGQVGGAVMSAPAMGGILGKVPGLAMRAGGGLMNAGKNIASAAGQGAILGAAKAVPESENESQDRIQNAVSGAKWGVGGQVFGEAASSLAGKLSRAKEGLKNFAETRAAAATGLFKRQSTKSVLLDSVGEEGEGLKELGRYALDNGIVKSGDSIESILAKAAKAKQAAGAKIGKIYSDVDKLSSSPEIISKLPEVKQSAIKATAIDPRTSAQEFLEQAKSKFTGAPNGKQGLHQAESIAEDFINNGGEMSIPKAQEFKQKLDDIIYKSDQAFARSGVQTPGHEALVDFRHFLKGKIDARIGALDQSFGSVMGSDLKKLNNDYSQLSDIHNLARYRYASDVGNNFLSLTDKMAGIGGAGVGAAEGYRHEGLAGAAKGALMGGAAGLASKGMRTYGRSTVAATANSVSKMLPAETPFLDSLESGLDKYLSSGGGAAAGGLLSPKTQTKKSDWKSRATNVQ